MQFTNEELRNIAILLERTQITGKEAVFVAMLQQKLAGMVKQPKEEEKE